MEEFCIMRDVGEGEPIEPSLQGCAAFSLLVSYGRGRIIDGSRQGAFWRIVEGGEGKRGA